MTVNKAILVGRLGDDPEMRDANGTPVANFRIATDRKYEKSNGEKKEETEWHRIVVFGNQATACGDYLSKGRQVYVEGRIQTNEWEDRDGNTQYTTEVVAQTVQFLSGGSNPDGRQPKSGPSPNNRAVNNGDSGGGSSSGSGGDDGWDDDEWDDW
jgi:single-strand DNA-binding protein